MRSGARLIGLPGPRGAQPGARAAVYTLSLGCLVSAAAALGRTSSRWTTPTPRAARWA
jgi:hypothetical protein